MVTTRISQGVDCHTAHGGIGINCVIEDNIITLKGSICPQRNRHIIGLITGGKHLSAIDGQPGTIDREATKVFTSTAYCIGKMI